MKQEFFAKRLFDGQQMHSDVAFAVEDQKIVSLITNAKASPQMTVLKNLVAPGFIDVQVNGGGGKLFNQDPSLGTIANIGRAHSRFGTTGFFPTVITDDYSVMLAAANAVSNAIAESQPGVLGIHFEGPHLSVKRKGVHAQEHIRALTDEEFTLFTRQDLGKVIVTLAPENVSTEDIKRLSNAGVLVCLGHSNASFEQTQEAIKAGARGFTHLFNAMSPFQSREPGMVGAALLDEDTWCGLIVDGYHVHSASLQVAIKAKSLGKMMLVTDAMPPVGSEQHSFSLYGQEIIRTGDRLNAATGELAGSVLDMASAVKNTVTQLKLPLVEALKMASVYPADFTCLANKLGVLACGQQADFVVLNNDIQVQQTWIAGQCVYQNDQA